MACRRDRGAAGAGADGPPQRGRHDAVRPARPAYQDIGWVCLALPAFDPFASARPVGEALGRVSRDGVDVFTYGFDNREAVSPYMFYAGRRLPVVGDAHGAERRLAGRRACALVPARVYGRLTPPGLALLRRHRAVGELDLVLVSGSADGCPDTPLEGPTFRDRLGAPEARAVLQTVS